jgi:glutathionyl-hydroquinone reductase
MGMLVDGKWVQDDAVLHQDGKFVRKPTSFHNWIKADGSTPFTPEAGRYHLYISLACPWAHRTLIFRKLKGLEEIIDLSVVDHFMADNGWSFGDRPGCIPDPIHGASYMHQIYSAADPDYTGRITVPVLWDKKTGTIVNNESSEIIRMLNTEFAAFSNNDYDFYPEDLRADIDAINERVYSTLNNGVYRCGFASSQEAYEQAFDELFATLDFLEEILANQRYLTGDRITEADWRLFVTLIRFDAVYVSHFKCNLHRIDDYASLSNYVRDLYQMPGIADTVNMHHIKHHYYGSHESINPRRIVPKGPALDYDRPHDRNRFDSAAEANPFKPETP